MSPSPRSAPHLSRRTVTTGTAWAVPAVLAATTVPSFASSGCVPYTPAVECATVTSLTTATNPYTSLWGAPTGDNPVNTKQQATIALSDGYSVVITQTAVTAPTLQSKSADSWTYLGSRATSERGTTVKDSVKNTSMQVVRNSVSTSTIPGLTLGHTTPYTANTGPLRADVLAATGSDITIEFFRNGNAVKVSNLEFTIGDIDWHVDMSGGWVDTVHVDQISTFTVATGSTVKGSGTATDPLRSSETSNLNSGATVDLTSATATAPVSKVSLHYRNHVPYVTGVFQQTTDSSQYIALTKITFEVC